MTSITKNSPHFNSLFLSLPPIKASTGISFCSLLDVSNMFPQTIALNLKFPNGTVKHVADEEDADTVLRAADLVIYGSFLEEHTFPDILLTAMCFGKPIVAPDLQMIQKYVGTYCKFFFK